MIKRFETKDIESITRIYNYYISNTEISFEESEVTNVEMSKRVSKIIDSGLPWLVNEVDGAVVGYAYAAKWHERTAYGRTAEITVYLDSKYSGKGYGSQLYSQLLNELKNIGICTVIGVIALPNQSSVSLHEKFGMKKVGHLEKIGFKNNKWLDVGYWQLMLSDA